MKKTILFAFLILLSVSCSGGNSNNSSSPDEAVSKSTVLAPLEVGSHGCLSMHRLLARLHNFPETTAGRIYSQNINVNVPENTSKEFKSFVAHAAFKYQQTRWSDILNYDMDIHFTSATQKDCSKVTLFNETQNGEDYQIAQASDSDLLMSQPDRGTLIDVTLVDSHTIQLHLVYPVMDMSDSCSTDPKSAMIDTTQILTWTDNEDSLAPSESVKSDMLNLLSLSLSSAPTDLDISDDDTTTLPVSVLAELDGSATAESFQSCASP
jgi:hypothetical protein